MEPVYNLKAKLWNGKETFGFFCAIVFVHLFNPMLFAFSAHRSNCTTTSSQGGGGGAWGAGLRRVGGLSGCQSPVFDQDNHSNRWFVVAPHHFVKNRIQSQTKNELNPLCISHREIVGVLELERLLAVGPCVFFSSYSFQFRSAWLSTCHVNMLEIYGSSCVVKYLKKGFVTHNLY